MTRKPAFAAATCLWLTACAGTAPGGRPQLTAPPAISWVYSSVDMDFRLATSAPMTEACSDAPCAQDRSFDRQVAAIGARLARAAYGIDPQLRQRVPRFTFTVADKSAPGSASDSQGDIVIFRGVRSSASDEKALAFLIAREMGHVMARHHDEKSATGILLSVIVQLLMPFTNLTGALALLTGSTASVVGTQVVSARNGPDLTREADAIAYELVRRQGWSERQVAASLASCAKTLGTDPWSLALKQSMEQIAKVRGDKSAVSKA